MTHLNGLSQIRPLIQDWAKEFHRVAYEEYSKMASKPQSLKYKKDFDLLRRLLDSFEKSWVRVAGKDPRTDEKLGAAARRIRDLINTNQLRLSAEGIRGLRMDWWRKFYPEEIAPTPGPDESKPVPWGTLAIVGIVAVGVLMFATRD